MNHVALEVSRPVPALWIALRLLFDNRAPLFVGELYLLVNTGLVCVVPYRIVDADVRRVAVVVINGPGNASSLCSEFGHLSFGHTELSWIYGNSIWMDLVVGNGGAVVLLRSRFDT